jgi:acetyl-CoA C-acetyltransferase
MPEAIVIAARRTAIGRAGGLHKSRRLEDLAAPLLRAVLDDSGLAAGLVAECIIGNAAGGGGNPARLIALAAGLPESVPAFTLDRQCASGLDAIVTAARMIQAGAADAVMEARSPPPRRPGASPGPPILTPGRRVFSPGPPSPPATWMIRA